MKRLCPLEHFKKLPNLENQDIGKDAMGYMIPRFLGAGRYFPVGQIRDEGYVYGSFAQSKAYQMDVR